MNGTYYEGVIYYGTPQVTAWQGLNPYISQGEYLIAGSHGVNGTLFIGDISTSYGTYYDVLFPEATATSVYSSLMVTDDVIRMVGSIKFTESFHHEYPFNDGFSFEGTLNDLNQSSNYIRYHFPSYITYLHSTAGDLIVVSEIFLNFNFFLSVLFFSNK
jgi:hypothetical protein